MVAIAPAGPEVGDGRREHEPRVRGATPAGGSNGPIRQFEPGRCERCVQLVDLPFEAALPPLEAQGHPQGLRDGPAVGLRAGPVEESIFHPGPAIHGLVPELDLIRRDAHIQDVKDAGERVLPAGEADDDQVVLVGREKLAGVGLYLHRQAYHWT